MTMLPAADDCVVSTMAIDVSRCYPLSSLLPLPIHGQSRGEPIADDFFSRAKELMERCCRNSSRKGSLYCGGLGPHVYLRYQMFKMLMLSSKDDTKRKRRNRIQGEKLLRFAREAAEHAYQCSSSSSVRVSLLEGKQLGALCMLAAIDHQLTKLSKSDAETFQKAYELSHIVSWLDAATYHLAPSECEVLYGRAGAIQAILFLRQECEDPSIGQDLVVRLATEILREGRRHNHRLSDAASRTCSLALSWEWHGKLYLGAAHGVVGVLQTLLTLIASYSHDWSRIELQFPHAKVWIQQSIQTLTSGSIFCHASGNLKSSVSNLSHTRGTSCQTDRLVHWCHGAPGLILLWIQASKAFPKHREVYLSHARRLANDVLYPRGLLRKGVGLCHGISGNGIVLMRLATVLESPEECTDWRDRSLQYAQFAITRLDELESTPDRPYSVFEGVGGLVCFLLQYAAALTENTRDVALREDLLRFPIYEF